MGKDGDLSPAPGHAASAANTEVSELGERIGRQIEVIVGASFTAVRDGNVDALAIQVDDNHPVAQRVLVWVNTVVARVGVKEQVTGGCDHVVVVVGDSASAETSSIVRHLTSVATSQEATSIAARCGRGRSGRASRRGCGSIGLGCGRGRGSSGIRGDVNNRYGTRSHDGR